MKKVRITKLYYVWKTATVEVSDDCDWHSGDDEWDEAYDSAEFIDSDYSLENIYCEEE